MRKIRSTSAWIVLFGLLVSNAVFADESPLVASASAEAEDARDQALPGNTSKVSESISDSNQESSPFWANYYGILYGPSVSSPSSFQSTPSGARNYDEPVFTKNYLTAGFSLSDHVAIAATGWWNYIPVQGGDLITQDPSVRVAYNDIIHTEHFNWYGDIRGYIPVTNLSRASDLIAGVQMFHYFSYIVPDSPLTLGVYASLRYNAYGSQGYGDDMELYIAPAASYQLSPSLALTGLYEFSQNHAYGADPFVTYNAGTVLEPGVEWSVTQAVTLNPYLYIYTNGPSNTGVGATLSWLMF
jgi:hypothetical protein